MSVYQQPERIIPTARWLKISIWVIVLVYTFVIFLINSFFFSQDQILGFSLSILILDGTFLVVFLFYLLFHRPSRTTSKLWLYLLIISVVIFLGALLIFMVKKGYQLENFVLFAGLFGIFSLLWWFVCFLIAIPTRYLSFDPHTHHLQYISDYRTNK